MTKTNKLYQKVYSDMIPDNIKGSRTKLVYLYLGHFDEPVNMQKMQSDLDISQLSLYPIVQSLNRKGYIEENQDGYERIT